MQFDKDNPNTWTVIGFDDNDRYLIRTGNNTARIYNALTDTLSGEHSLEFWLSLDLIPYVGSQDLFREFFNKNHSV